MRFSGALFLIGFRVGWSMITAAIMMKIISAASNIKRIFLMDLKRGTFLYFL